MRVLFLSPTLPWPLDAGGRIRTYQLLHGVSEEHEVHLWAVRQPEAGEEHERELREVCAELRVFERTDIPVPRRWLAPAPESWFHSAPFEAALAEAYSGGQFDLVHIDELCLSRSVFELQGPPEVLHHHKLDVELARGLYLAGRSTLLETMRWRALEELAASRFRQHIFCTQEDADDFGARHTNSNAHIVPNGVDLDYFRPQDIERDPNELLFLGSLDYEPNQQGLERLLELVWPALRARHPQASLVVVGRAPSAELLRSLPPGVHLIPDVDDVRPYLARASALVVPLEIGGGSRLKIAEALAMGCPVISTEVGAQGFAARVTPRAARVDDLLPLLSSHIQTPGVHATDGADLTELSWERARRALGEAWNSSLIGARAPELQSPNRPL